MIPYEGQFWQFYIPYSSDFKHHPDIWKKILKNKNKHHLKFENFLLYFLYFTLKNNLYSDSSPSNSSAESLFPSTIFLSSSSISSSFSSYPNKSSSEPSIALLIPHF